MKMRGKVGVVLLAGCVAAVATSVRAQVSTGTSQRAAPIKAEDVPKRKKVAPLPPRGTYKPPRTPWGDPDIAGAYNNSDESGIPFERPDSFAGRKLSDITQAERDGTISAAAIG